MAKEGCEVKDRELVEGVTSKMKEQLQCRKKAYPGQTEAERWKEIYQMLFPGKIAPNPCQSLPVSYCVSTLGWPKNF